MIEAEGSGVEIQHLRSEIKWPKGTQSKVVYLCLMLYQSVTLCEMLKHTMTGILIVLNYVVTSFCTKMLILLYLSLDHLLVFTDTCYNLLINGRL